MRPVDARAAKGTVRPTSPPHASVPSAVIVELRQYTLHPRQRDVLIELFDREFVETQEAVGMTVIGQFRDLDDPDRFVWLRGYPDMATRAAGLNAFYGGPTWMAHRDRANATMIDSDNVLLLEPASNATAISVGPRSTATSGDSLVIATIYSLRPESASSFPKLFDEIARPMLVGAGRGPGRVRHVATSQQLPTPADPGRRARVRGVLPVPGRCGSRCSSRYAGRQSAVDRRRGREAGFESARLRRDTSPCAHRPTAPSGTTLF